MCLGWPTSKGKIHQPVRQKAAGVGAFLLVIFLFSVILSLLFAEDGVGESPLMITLLVWLVKTGLGQKTGG